ncbi:multidrug efflux MATE transporter MepA [Faecalicatena orotica]|uniref:Multidrug export protein MepA n=1 Tax=Faecalicatena orotica TaxID=1544 RepID=A0A2Y9BFP2_9FIRM|nr:MATE family efflux transporter [Faecalicatena orotica]PWJ28496.1 putative MATE family efflux protein [Faecalicatena orotica]SSA56315.1 putative efflux protein, MATE family [Faecalicatena orotica]
MNEQVLKSQELFHNKPVWKAVFSLAVPSCITILIMVFYNMADMFFIGQLGDAAQVAAVSVVGPVFSLVMAVATMIGVGGCSVIAGASGEGDIEKAKICSSVCCLATLIFGIICLAGIAAGAKPLLHFLGAGEEIIPYAETYMKTLTFGVPFMLFSTAMACILRADGAIKEGLLGNMAGTVLNIILDPILILGFHMGVSGAAVATVTGNLVSSIFYIYYIIKKADVLTISPIYARKNPKVIFHIMAVGLPNGISGLLSGFASTFANQLLAGYGTNAIAAMAAAGKATMIIGMIQMGICMGVQPLMAYNYGSNNLARLKEILQKVGLLTFLLGLFAAAASFLARHELIGLFLKNTDAIAMGESMLLFLVIASPVVGFYYLSTSFLQAAGNAMAATGVSLLRQGVLLIPSLYFMNRILGFTGIAAAHTVADGVSAGIAFGICLWRYHMLMKKQVKKDDIPVTPLIIEHNPEKNNTEKHALL